MSLDSGRSIAPAVRTPRQMHEDRRAGWCVSSVIRDALVVNSKNGTECDVARTQLLDVAGDFDACQSQNIVQKTMVSRAFPSIDTYGSEPYT